MTNQEIQILEKAKEISKNPINEIKVYNRSNVAVMLICSSQDFGIYIGINTNKFYAICDKTGNWYSFK